MNIVITNSAIVVKLILATTCSLQSLLSSIYSTNLLNDALKELYVLDLDYLLSIINELVKDHENNSNLIITKAMIGMHDIIDKINNELQVADDLITIHKAKYFNTWRYFDISDNISKIKDLKHLLDSRYKIFIDLLSLYK